MANTDIYSLAEALGAKNLTRNLGASPLGRKYLLQQERAKGAEEFLDSSKTAGGAITGGIALYLERKQENKALEELNTQMQAEQEAKAARRESLINALPEANRVIAGALTNEDDLAKYAMQTLTPPSEEDKLALENKRLQNRKLQKEINTPISIGGTGSDKAPAGYRFTQAGELEAIPGGPATKQSAESSGKVALIKQGLSDTQELENSLLDKNGSFNRRKIIGMRSPGRIGARDEYSKLFNSINARLRLESGAAVPESEVKRAFETFAPNPLDSDETIRSKLARQKQFFLSAEQEIGQGRGAQPTNPTQNSFTSSSGVKFTIKR